MQLATMRVVLGAGASTATMPSFDSWAARFNKTYGSPAEAVLRSKTYAANVATIEAHNQLHSQGKVTYTMGVNLFSDLSADEFKALVSSPFNRTTPRTETWITPVRPCLASVSAPAWAHRPKLVTCNTKCGAPRINVTVHVACGLLPACACAPPPANRAHILRSPL